MSAPIPESPTTHQRSEVGDPVQVPTIGSQPEQARFPDPIFAACRAPRRRRLRPTAPPTGPQDVLLETFAIQSPHFFTLKTARQYRWALGDVLKLAAERRGCPVLLLELFEDQELLGSILTSTARAGGGPEVAGWTVPARRSAVFAAASVLGPELRRYGIADARAAVEAALRLHAVRIGSTYRLPKALARNYGRGPTLTAEELAALFEAAGNESGWLSDRDAALFQAMFFSGGRVNAVRDLDGAAIYREPDGGGRMLVHAKHPKDSGEFLIPAAVMERIDKYAAGFNSWAVARGLSVRVGVGVEGALWRSRRGRLLSYDEIRRQLTLACTGAGVRRITPHAFRHLFASLATEDNSRAASASAGGWAGPRLMDAHYVRRNVDDVRKRMAAIAGRHDSDDADIAPIREPATVR